MSYYVADVGEVIIKPEHRKDFGHFFRREYDMVECDPLKKFAADIIRSSSTFTGLFNMSKWSHENVLGKWEGLYETRYDNKYGGFVYGVSYYEGPREFFTELLPQITERIFEKESVRHSKTLENLGENSPIVSYHEVGMIIIKPMYREDFDFFYHGQYSRVRTELMKDFVEKYLRIDDFIELRYWKHGNEYEDWRGKYQTSYDEDSGRFVFGVSYNIYGHDGITEFFEILPEITETEISRDSWTED